MSIPGVSRTLKDEVCRISSTLSAGLITENWRSGRKRHLWISIASDLRFDSRRWGSYCSCPACTPHIVRSCPLQPPHVASAPVCSCLSTEPALALVLRRDLDDIGATDIAVQPLNKLPYGKIDPSSKAKFGDGVIFLTYSSLISSSDKVRIATRTAVSLARA